MEEQITQFLINMAPAITAIVTVIVATVNMVKSFKKTSNEIRSDADIRALVEENQKLRKENAAIVQSVREQIKVNYKLHQDLERGKYNRR